MSQKTAFLSHRRDATGKAFARSLEQALTHCGYDVFLDVDSMEPGRWEQQLLREVPGRAHFLLLLTPGALVGCHDEQDWVRREYELAVRNQRNIVPVREESFDIDQERAACPECMRSVFDWQIAIVAHAAFERDVEELVRRFIPPHKAPWGKHPACQSQDDRKLEAYATSHAISRLRHTAPQLFGREAAIQRLDEAWVDPRRHVVVIRNWGGIGKTSLVAEWIAEWGRKDWQGVERFFDWTFYSQGTRRDGAGGDRAASADQFIAAALAFCGAPGSVV